MIRDLDDTIRELLEPEAPAGSELEGADISFDLPDAEWRASLTTLTVNCYLYDVQENRDLRTNELPTGSPLETAAGGGRGRGGVT